MPRRVAAALGLILGLALWVAPAAGAERVPQPPRPDATAWMLVDADDEDVISGHRPRAELPMASATKLMTAYLALRELDLDEVVTAAPYKPEPAESLMKLRRGEQVSVHDLLYGLLLASGNDAAVTLAVAAAGSEDAFVAQMNRAAEGLGLSDTSYENPIGFDDPDQYTSASDLVELTIDLRRDPAFRGITDTPSIELTEGERPRRIVNRNNLVRTVPWVDGVKTGFTAKAGYVLVGSGERKGVTLVSAVLGASSEAERDGATLELLRYGFSLYRRETVLRDGERLGEVAIRDRDVTVPLAAAKGVRLTLRRDEDVEVRLAGVPAEIEGPIERGQALGTAVVTVDGAVEARVGVVATRSAEAASLIERIDAGLPGTRVGAWGLLILGAVALALVLAPLVIWLWRRRSLR
ncbi:MAG: D-alanyl-D-alanine carboxypeptidase family protein [bacterium]